MSKKPLDQLKGDLRDWLFPSLPTYDELDQLGELAPELDIEAERALCGEQALHDYLTEIQRDLPPDPSPIPPHPGLLEQFRVLVASLLSPSPGLVLQGIRGKNDFPRVYRAEEIEVTIEVRPEEPSYRKIIGSILGTECYDMKVYLYHGRQLNATVDVEEEFGEFIICQIPPSPSPYTLIVESPVMQVCIPELEIQSSESQNGAKSGQFFRP